MLTCLSCLNSHVKLRTLILWGKTLPRKIICPAHKHFFCTWHRQETIFSTGPYHVLAGTWLGASNHLGWYEISVYICHPKRPCLSLWSACKLMCRTISKHKNLMGVDHLKYLRLTFRCHLDKHKTSLKKATINNSKYQEAFHPSEIIYPWKLLPPD